MERYKKIFIYPVLLLLCFCFNQSAQAQQIYTDTIPLGGNAWVKEPAVITDDGVTNWSDSATVVSIFFRIGVPQTISLALRLNVPQGSSEINVVAENTTLTKQLSNKDFAVIEVGKLNITRLGYVNINLKGISKTGAVFANISDLIIRHVQPDSNLVYVKRGSSFHFGRRGPSVHLRYPVPDKLQNDVHWFYNEITVPAGMDKLGSYFMADGFGEGYFGMQVNSETERRILFSVWSPFETENPKNIPDSLRIVLLKKGAKVQANDFGNEGSGGQSFMRFNWQAGKTYAFLLGAQPDSFHHTTTYTAYFKDVSANKWYLVASFKRPQTVTYLTHLYSFLENFIPETGDQMRAGWYKNQWIVNANKQWHELTQAIFTADATAKGGYRKDYAGGADGGHFFLRNDGFFNDFVSPNQSFERKASGTPPVIDFSRLPQQ